MCEREKYFVCRDRVQYPTKHDKAEKTLDEKQNRVEKNDIYKYVSR